MPYRLAVLDVDGTLLDSTGAIRLRVREAVQAAHEHGCLVTLASGRRLSAIRSVARELGVATPLILYNGGLVYDLERESALYLASLSADAVAAAVHLIWGAGHQPVVYENPLHGERVFTGPLQRDGAAEAHYFARPRFDTVRLDRSTLATIADPLLLTAMGESEEVEALAELVLEEGIICQTLIEQQSFVPGSRWWQLDLMAPGCSKGSALLRLCELTGVSPAETIAIGDGINDLELIKAAGLGVAMGNAVAAVRDAAQASVADNDCDGVAEALETYVLGPCRVAGAGH
jgi:Cof subfamily protein (haloacid dehalogenase superfamily)